MPRRPLACPVEDSPAPAHQRQLLRCVDQGIFQRIGEMTARQVQARIIATSSADLKTCDPFRRDLYCRPARLARTVR
ncbi:sigma 54-interacting transcriptional regulator [Aquicoccus sp. SU-CL01552]|uniref:sigma 54-interacting transcriptional regulator n=1 Tax=Aquicoccus sp. SU-CL01552 TaxID=3127656 RepID=UPI00334045A8